MKSLPSGSALGTETSLGGVILCRAFHPPADAVDQVRSRERAALDIAVAALRKISGGSGAEDGCPVDDARAALAKIAEILRPPN